MSKKEKLIKRLLSVPTDFTFSETVTLLKLLGYRLSNKGKTSGSRVRFISDKNADIMFHKPHPEKELKEYQVKHLIQRLTEEDLL